MKLLEKPLAVEFAISIADWMLVVSRFIDIRDQTADSWVKPEDMLAFASRDKNSPGKGMVEDTQRMLDVAIASYALLSGDLTALAVLEALTAPVEIFANAENARKARYQRAVYLFKHDDVLAANVGMLYLHKRFFETQGAEVADVPGAGLLYNHASTFALDASTGALRFTQLQAQFGKETRFVADDSASFVSEIRVIIADDGGEVLSTPLPPPTLFHAGQLVYYERFARLFAKRDLVAERILDYEAFACRDKEEPDAFLNKEEREALAIMIAYGGRPEAQ